MKKSIRFLLSNSEVWRGLPTNSDTKARCGVLCASHTGTFQEVEAQTTSASAKTKDQEEIIMSKEQENKAIVGRWFTHFGARPAISELLTRLRRRICYCN